MKFLVFESKGEVRNNIFFIAYFSRQMGNRTIKTRGFDAVSKKKAYPARQSPA
jgi:hypothetical protein